MADLSSKITDVTRKLFLIKITSGFSNALVEVGPTYWSTLLYQTGQQLQHDSKICSHSVPLNDSKAYM